MVPEGNTTTDEQQGTRITPALAATPLKRSMKSDVRADPEPISEISRDRALHVLYWHD